MFDSLADRIRQDEHNEVSNNERLVRWLAMLVISLIVFGGLYMGIRMLEG
jgi:Ni,Fe-hydrogenase I cytochrome b subunit